MVMKVVVLMMVLLRLDSSAALGLDIGKSKYTAMYVFGDSLSDNGNNKYFGESLAKANFLPYGVDFSTGPSGRFCNGKIFVDFLGEMHGLPLLPSYADVIVKGADFRSGVNYASAGAGILNDTGYRFGRVIPLGEQISNFKKSVWMLKKQMGENEGMEYLRNALVVVDIGANDYLNNYLKPKYYESSHIYNPHQFAHLLIHLYKDYILEIQSLGATKFFLSEASPIGCSPIRINNGKCESSSNELAQMLNTRIKSLVASLNTEYPESAFMFAAPSQPFIHLLENAEAYGFKVNDTACCGDSNRGGTKPLCFRNSVPCSNRDEYVFWDAAHPSEATNRILAHIIYNSTSWL